MKINPDSPEYWFSKKETDSDLMQYFNALQPAHSAEFIESSGLGSVLKSEDRDLESVENRVFKTTFKNTENKDCEAVLKLYRPDQWPEESLLEEHLLMRGLTDAGVNIVAPMRGESDNSLWKHNGIFFTVFPFKNGKVEEITDDFPTAEQTIQLGKTIGEMHEVAAHISITARPSLKPETYGRGNLEFLKRNTILPTEFHAEVTDILEETIAIMQPLFKTVPIHAIHADLYEGNILWNDGVPFIIDFDDMMTGPAVQDIRMLFRGRDERTKERIQLLLKGYREVRFFDEEWLKLIEPMRILRVIWYLAWVASRQHDSRFDDVMPGFGSEKFWHEQMTFLREQIQRVRAVDF